MAMFSLMTLGKQPPRRQQKVGTAETQTLIVSAKRYLYSKVGWREGLIDSRRYQGLRGFICLFKESAKLRRNRWRFKAVADPDNVIWVRPNDVVYKLNYDLDITFNDVLSGDWDLTRRAKLEGAQKHRSVYERFVRGLSWTDTDLFRSIYARRIADGAEIRGVRSIDDLAKKYSKQIDRLFEDMRQNGFVVKLDIHGYPKNLPHIHIGRNGELLFGNNGNHRLAMAKILGLERIPCRVRARHLLWQRTRDKVAEHLKSRPSVPLEPSLAAHPDLADIFGKRTEPSPPTSVSRAPAAKVHH